MGLLIKLAVTAVLGAIVANYVFNQLIAAPPLPKLDTKWWGPGQPQKVDQSVRPFKINISQEVLDDLNDRLELFPEPSPPLEGVGFEYGFNSEYLKEVVRYWREKYDWRKREVLLNGLPQFKTYVDGLDLHFIHAKPQKVPVGIQVVPLLLMHGWPGSIREFYGLIPLLTVPRPGMNFVFEVVAPSLPGYGFSDAASKQGLGAAQMAVVMRNLMKKLGFDKFYAQGGDWGSLIATIMGSLFPDEVLGIHLNFCHANTPLTNLKWMLGSLWPTLVVQEEHVKKMYPVGSIVANIMKEMGYSHLQATKPDTVGASLTDSPAGLAAYILEKFSTWTNPAWQSRRDGGLTVKYTLDDLLDNIMIYWVTGSITTSMRLYSETLNKAHYALGFDSDLKVATLPVTTRPLTNVTKVKFVKWSGNCPYRIPVDVPTACALFPNELVYQPELLLKDKYTNLVQVTNMARGGHFAAFEEPVLLASDIVSSVKLMLRLGK